MELHRSSAVPGRAPYPRASGRPARPTAPNSSRTPSALATPWRKRCFSAFTASLWLASPASTRFLSIQPDTALPMPHEVGSRRHPASGGIGHLDHRVVGDGGEGTALLQCRIHPRGALRPPYIFGRRGLNRCCALGPPFVGICHGPTVHARGAVVEPYSGVRRSVRRGPSVNLTPP